MTILYLGIILFGGCHLFSILFPAYRDRIEARLGEKAFKGLFAITSLMGVVMLAIGYWQSRSGPLATDMLYVPADWTRHANMLFVLLAFIFLAASHGNGYLRTWTHNPMSIGIALWSGGHLLANGKRTDVYLFGTFLIVSLADILMSEIRGKRPAHQPLLRADIIAVIAGMILYVVFLFGFHPYVLNLPVAG